MSKSRSLMMFVVCIAYNSGCVTDKKVASAPSFASSKKTTLKNTQKAHTLYVYAEERRRQSLYEEAMRFFEESLVYDEGFCPSLYGLFKMHLFYGTAFSSKEDMYKAKMYFSRAEDSACEKDSTADLIEEEVSKKP